LPDALLESVIRKIFAAGIVGTRLSVVWHAGEPLALPVAYYQQALRTVRKCATARTDRNETRITHAIQTNGMLINQEWCDFIRQNDIYMGISLDGPAFLHDLHRKDRRGMGTHSKVMRGLEQLQRNDIDFHVIAVVTSSSVEYPDEIFRFFLENGIRNVGFNIEELEGVNKNSSLVNRTSDAKVLSFFERMYELQKASGGALTIREFDRAFRSIAQSTGTEMGPGTSNEQTAPFGIVSVDVNGNVSTFSPELLGISDPTYVDFCFGNLATHEFYEIASNTRFLQVLDDIQAGVKLCADRCEHYSFCGGGAPSNKLFENGSFASTETMYCRYTIKIPFDIVLKDLEKSLGLNGTT
jgi:uncharacterized protein